eukprot:2388069-Pyramimonas_sp.AAC.1
MWHRAHQSHIGTIAHQLASTSNAEIRIALVSRRSLVFGLARPIRGQTGPWAPGPIIPYSAFFSCDADSGDDAEAMLMYEFHADDGDDDAVDDDGGCAYHSYGGNDGDNDDNYDVGSGEDSDEHHSPIMT